MRQKVVAISLKVLVGQLCANSKMIQFFALFPTIPISTI